MLSKEKLEQLRIWFLEETPKDAVLNFKEKCERLLASPKTFIEMISDVETINSMSVDLSKILTVQKQLMDIKNFFDKNQESEGGYSPFEYMFATTVTLSEDKIAFIKEQYIFFKKIHAIASQIKQNNPKEDFLAFTDQVIPILEKTCGNRTRIKGYLEEYAEFMSCCLTVDEANEKYKQSEKDGYVMDQNAYESFLNNGKVIVDQVSAYRKKMKESGIPAKDA